MREVTRYDLTEDVITGVIDVTPVPQNMEGRYVAYEDYATLKAERDALEAELESAKISLTENYLRVTKERNDALYKVIELNAKMPEIPATAAELVPDARPDLPDHYSGDIEYRGMCDGWNSCRAAMLRKIEEAK